MKIIEAEGESDYAAARDLIAAYQRWLGVDLEFQGFSKELETLSVMYGPPDGAMLLAEEGGVWVGCVGLRRLGGGDAEMKRMSRSCHADLRGGRLHSDSSLSSQSGPGRCVHGAQARMMGRSDCANSGRRR